MPQSVFIVDDHAMVREGLSAIITQHPALEVVGEASSGEEALEKIAAAVPDLVIADISMNGMNGITLTETLLARHADLPILIVSMHEKEVYQRKALAAGARGYLAKRQASDTLVESILAILADEE